MEECIAFSEAAGMMTSQEAEMARKTGGKGPGGCKNKDECEAFCNNTANQETCFNFGRDNGMIPPEELQKMEQGKQQFSQSINQAPAQVTECLANAIGADQLEKFKSGTAMPTRDIGDKMGDCFRQTMGPGGPGEGGNIPPGGQNGQFQPGPGTTNPGGQMMPQQAGPGGCKTPEECRSYCTSNPEACKNFAPSGTPGNMPGGQSQGQDRRCEGENCKQISPTGQTDVREGMQQIINGVPGELRRTIEGVQGMMPKIQPGTPTRGQIPSTGSGQVPVCAPGTQCPQGPNMPGTQPGNERTENFEPGMGMGGSAVPPQVMGGGTLPPGEIPQEMQQKIEQQIQQQMQQVQQQMQQFQQPPTGSGGGGMVPPPPGSGTPPPPPAGGSLFKSIQSFFGL